MNIIDTLFLVSSLVPIGLGIGFMTRPRAMNKAQVWFRKKLQNLQTRAYREHQKVGLCFVIWGIFMVYTYFQPIWIYHAFMVGRLVAGYFFPSAFPTIQTVGATQAVFI